MKKSIFVAGLLLSLLIFGNIKMVHADGSKPSNQKPPHYGDWDVIYDKVMKRTTLIHQHRPMGEHMPGMGDAFTAKDFQLEYSLEAIIVGHSGDKNFKVSYYWLFDNPLQRNATLTLAVQNRFFKYSPETQFTLLIDDQSKTIPVENYHTGEYGDSFIGHFPFEELRVPLSQADLNKMMSANEIDGNLSSDDQNAGKSFKFDDTFKQILTAFVFRVNELSINNPQ